MKKKVCMILDEEFNKALAELKNTPGSQREPRFARRILQVVKRAISNRVLLEVNPTSSGASITSPPADTIEWVKEMARKLDAAAELPEPERCLQPTAVYAGEHPCMLLTGHEGECDYAPDKCLHPLAEAPPCELPLGHTGKHQ